jgi:senataxin
MRDALVFLTEMLDEIRAFEAAVTGISVNSGEDTPKKLSSHGRDLVDSLNEPLNKLLTWLRLNDDDLLDQAVAAIIRMLNRFAKAKMSLTSDALKQLRKTVERYRDPKSRKDSQLKAEQLDSLVAAVARHPEYEEEFSKIEAFGRKTSRVRVPDADITVIESDPAESDSESDSVEVVAAPSKSTIRPKEGDRRSKSTTGSKGKVPLAMKGTSAIPSTAVKSGSKAHSSSGATFKVSKTQPAQPLPKYKTAPTKMKNALYSHSAMRAAKDQDSSDDEWSDANRPSALARLAEQRAKLEEASKAKLQQPRKTKMLELQEKPRAMGQQKGQRIMTAAEIHQKNQNKARMRYNPDYTDLHRQILQWNYNHQGSIPHEGFRFPRSIPAAFENARHYIETFYPLLLLECWNEIASAREELQIGTNESEPFTGRLAGRLSVDDFVEIYINVDRMPERSPASENDIVLMKGHCETIAKVHQVLRKQGKVDVVLRVHLGRDNGMISHALVNGTKWTVHKLFT